MHERTQRYNCMSYSQREKRPCERRFLRVSHGEAYFFPTAQRKEQEQLATHRYVVFSVVCPCATIERRVPAASSPSPLPANAHARLPDPLHAPPTPSPLLTSSLHLPSPTTNTHHTR